MTFRDDVLAALDVDAFYRGSVEIGPLVGHNEYRFRCIFHEDREPSANVNLTSGLWHCHSENIGGGPIDFLMRRDGIDVKDAITALGEIAGVRRNQRAPSQAAAGGSSSKGGRRSLSDESVAVWAAAALRNVDLLSWFRDKRGFTEETLRQWEIGWDGERVTIPIRDADGKLVNVRRYLRNAPSMAQKMLSFRPGAGEARLWPLPLPATDVLLVEGEWDMILLRQQGFPNAVTVTSGAGIFKPEWVEQFRDRMVTICYDNDEAGRKGAQKVARMLAGTTNVFVLQIPGLPDKGDPTDFFVEQSRSADELRTLIADASPYIVTSLVTAEPTDSLRVSLNRASDAHTQGQRLEIPVLVSGKAMTPYTVPGEMHVHCDMSNKRLCSMCPLFEAGGVKDIAINAMSPDVLGLINVTDEGRYKAIKALAGAVAACNRPQVDISRWQNIEELRLIPELDTGTQVDAEGEYVSRTGFLIGHGTAANRSYLVRGYAHPHPKTQATVHLLSEAEPAQDNISSFAMSPELNNVLRQFRVGDDGDPEERWRDIYRDFASSVHRIQDRFDMQVAYDLAWHSVIAFHFNGSFVRRGWVEGMVMSDTGQGKTEMALQLRDHYRLGERVQAESASMAGLLGGLEKMGDTWLLGWGRIPLNDRRLLIVDETQGLSSTAIEGLSDVRATGVAEITKIRTERTMARCRIIWLANPITGLTLAQHNQGVLSIKELFKKPEDVRRLDFALCLAANDVDYARSINVAHGAATAPRYSSDACRSLVLWAWSRRPEQVVFTEDAVEIILRSATRQGGQYHPSIPLVQPSDQRLKLARLAAAAAARVYSTDELGEQLIVRRPHVEFIVKYLDRIYNAKAMAYGEYSDQQQRGESVDPENEPLIADYVRDWTNSQQAVEFLRGARVFKRSELEDVVGWETDYVRTQLRWLTSQRLIRTTREGFTKTPAFIAFLRGFSLSEKVKADVQQALQEAEF